MKNASSTVVPTFRDLAVERGLRVDTNSRDLARMASSMVYDEFLADSVYDTMQALSRLQREMKLAVSV